METTTIGVNPERENIRLKIEEIADVLCANQNKLRIGLMSGNMGIALFLFCYYHIHKKDEKILEKAFLLLDEVIERVNDGDIFHSICDGLAGIGWAINYLCIRKYFDTNDKNELLSSADDFLTNRLDMIFAKHQYDFLHGELGVGLYFTTRISDNHIFINGLNTILSHLIGSAERKGANVKWQSVLQKEETGKVTGYNISLAHGMSAIAVMLSKFIKHNICKEASKDLLDGLIQYLLSQRIDVQEIGSYFPTVSLESYKIGKSRLGWCYGDLGISIALWQVSQVLQNTELEKFAIEVLLHATKRKNLRDNSIEDAGLCHGTASVGHIFYRMWWNTRLPEFKNAADYWMNETLKMAKYKDGLAGYKASRKPEYGGFVNEYGLVEGIAGIGLALLFYYHEIEPTWDECLLLS